MPRGYPVHVRAHRRIVPQYVVSEVARTSCKRAALRYRLEDVQRPLWRARPAVMRHRRAKVVDDGQAGHPGQEDDVQR